PLIYFCKASWNSSLLFAVDTTTMKTLSVNPPELPYCATHSYYYIVGVHAGEITVRQLKLIGTGHKEEITKDIFKAKFPEPLNIFETAAVRRDKKRHTREKRKQQEEERKFEEMKNLVSEQIQMLQVEHDNNMKKIMNENDQLRLQLQRLQLEHNTITPATSKPTKYHSLEKPISEKAPIDPKQDFRSN
ncbi:hypothetical protein PFISCL1PPCAC_3127, partial [Pristionchus fissidentatus]